MRETVPSAPQVEVVSFCFVFKQTMTARVLRKLHGISGGRESIAGSLKKKKNNIT